MLLEKPDKGLGVRELRAEILDGQGWEAGVERRALGELCVGEEAGVGPLLSGLRTLLSLERRWLYGVSGGRHMIDWTGLDWTIPFLLWPCGWTEFIVPWLPERLGHRHSFGWTLRTLLSELSRCIYAASVLFCAIPGV